MDTSELQSLAPSPEAAPPAIKADPELNIFALTNYRNQHRRFGIKLDDRRRHMYTVGKTGMGKTTVLENMVLNDIYAGHGVGVVDPHGDFAEKIIDYIPSHRINDVVYFNPSDIDYPIGFNILETIRPEQKHLVASGLMGVFKKIWPDVWSARMEYILNNTILALLDFPGTTLLGINRLLADPLYRKRVVNNCKDPVVKAFWQTEFANYQDKFRTEAVAPIQNKIGQFLSASVIRNIVAQVKSRINLREIMDTKKIFIMNLSKGRIGEDNSRLLGGMLITRIQLAAMERVEIPEKERQDFFLYVDEFQNFATESFANILSEARKYRLDLIMAHQYMEQLDEKVLAAVIGNVGTTLVFRVGSSDAEILAKEFIPTFLEEDLVNLPKFHVYLKLMIDGVASRPFSALTLPPIGTPTASAARVIRVSRERYAVEREKIEDKIMRWSGMIIMDDAEAAQLDIDEEEAMFKHAEDKTKTPAPPTLAAPGPATPASSPLVSPPPALPARQPISQPRPAPRPVALATPPRQPGPRPALVPATPRKAEPNRPYQAGGAYPGGSPGEAGHKNRRRKKKSRPDSFSPANTAPVMLGDPGARGISLQELPGLPASRPLSSFHEPAQEAKISPPPAKPLAPPAPPLYSPVAPATPAPLDLGFLPSAGVPTPRPPKPEPGASSAPAGSPKTILPGQIEKIGD